MSRAAIGFGVVYLLAFVPVAQGGVINFTNPDVVGTRSCGTHTPTGPLELYVEQGVRVDIDDFNANMHPCALGVPVPGFPVYDMITGPGPYGPILLAGLDSGVMGVTSLTGAAIRGVRLDVVDGGHVGDCGLSRIQFATGSIPLPCGGPIDYIFANYGLVAGLTSFTVRPDIYTFIYVSELQVPEPTSLVLLGVIGLPLAVRRLRMKTTARRSVAAPPPPTMDAERSCL